jgi:hypothetical protein
MNTNNEQVFTVRANNKRDVVVTMRGKLTRLEAWEMVKDVRLDERVWTVLVYKGAEVVWYTTKEKAPTICERCNYQKCPDGCCCRC